MAKSKNKRKHNIKAKAKRSVVGLKIGWDDNNPEENTTDIVYRYVTHKNPYMRLHAKEIFRTAKLWIAQDQPFYWKADITVIFDYDNCQQHETRELLAYATIEDLTEHSIQAIECAKRHGDMEKFKTVRFDLECLSSYDPRDAS
jgi:hypothetical protein